MLACILITLAAAATAPLIHRALGRASGVVFGLLAGAICFYFATLISGVSGGLPLQTRYEWAPGLGVSLSFWLDGLSLLFALVISGVGAAIFIYTGSYSSRHPQLGRLYGYLLLFMASMLGVVLSDNLILLFIFWELTSFSSYLLIGFDHAREKARSAALQALLVTGMGGLALLAAFLLLMQASGFTELSELIQAGRVAHDDDWYVAIVILLLLGAGTKSAQAPFHFWLPNAMEAPAPVSAYLHSATMVKAGVYLLARFHPVLGGSDLWTNALTVVGLVTMVLGAVLALAHTDLKRVLAYSTVSALGTLVLLIGSGSEYAIEAAVVFLVVHSLYKGALFLVAGILDHETGARDLRRLGGLWRAMPLTALAAALAACSMAGLPPFLGFISKELLYQATQASVEHSALITAAAVIANVILFAIAAIVGLRPFLGRPSVTPKQAHEPPPTMWAGPLALSVAAVAGAFWLEAIGARLVAPAASAVLAETVEVELVFWHGWNVALALSAVTVVGGIAVYLARDQVRGALARLSGLRALGPQRWYDLGLDGLTAVAKFQTKFLQNGVLGRYMIIILLSFIGVTLWALPGSMSRQILSGWQDARLYEWVVAILVVFGALLVILTGSRLTAIAAMGAVGYGISTLFVLFGAPDLAMTQFAVETLTVVVFLLVVRRLPRFVAYSTRLQRARDAVVAVASGAVMTVLVLLATRISAESRLSAFYAAESYPSARGRNIVNVILVDFRGLDTMGEITVVAVAAIGVLGLLKLRLERGSRR